MRWIVASLVVINILAFVYFKLFTVSSEVEVSVAEESSRSPSLTLLEERKLESGVSVDASVSAGVVETLREKVLPQVPESAGVLEGAGEGSEQESEFTAAVNGQAICTLVGAFDRLLKAEYFVERLSALGLSSEIKNIAVEIETWYWLYLPPEASRKEALRRLSEVQQRGIESYVIPSGNLANAISLGTFSKKDLALAMRDTVIKQGYQPEISEVPREQKEIWVFLPQGEASKISAERWAELLSSQDYLQKRQNLCSDVASA
jgi:cell division septation protein DedD